LLRVKNGWAIWDDLHEGYYNDVDDVSEEFTAGAG
jgi:hypothetical protein